LQNVSLNVTSSRPKMSAVVRTKCARRIPLGAAPQNPESTFCTPTQANSPLTTSVTGFPKRRDFQTLCNFWGNVVDISSQGPLNIKGLELKLKKPQKSPESHKIAQDSLQPVWFSTPNSNPGTSNGPWHEKFPGRNKRLDTFGDMYIAYFFCALCTNRANQKHNNVRTNPQWLTQPRTTDCFPSCLSRHDGTDADLWK